jgi:tetratricopeptide (TPR) repeat protein
MSGSPEGASFADGVHVELWDKLSRSSAIELKSRSSVEQFRVFEERPPVSEISEALAGVDYLLEANSRVGGGDARIIAALIDVQADREVWAGSFDSPLAPEDILLQSELALQIADSIVATIAPDKGAHYEAPPPGNEEAHLLYLRARAAQDRGLSPLTNWDTLASAAELLEEAIVLDSTFALAHAELSWLHGQAYFLGRDRSESRLLAQRSAAETAFRLEPGLPQARMAMGYVHYVDRDYRRALEEFIRGLEGVPNDARAHLYTGMAYRRLGQWSEALASAQRAIAQSPTRASWYADILGLTLWATRQYAEASAAQSRALALVPEYWPAAHSKGMIHLAWDGQLDTLRAALSRTGTPALQTRVKVRLLERDPDSAVALLQGVPDRLWVDDVYIIRALSELSGWAHKMRGDEDAARAAFDSARVILEAHADQNPDDPRVHGGLGFAYAGLGRRDDAVRAAVRLTEANRGHPFEWAEMGHEVARTLAQAGDVERLLEVLESLLSGPSYISVKTVDVDWHYDPVRSDPRFQELLEKYRDDGED